MLRHDDVCDPADAELRADVEDRARRHSRLLRDYTVWNPAKVVFERLDQMPPPSGEALVSTGPSDLYGAVRERSYSRA